MSRDVYTDHEITNLRLDGIEDQLIRIADTLERIADRFPPTIAELEQKWHAEHPSTVTFDPQTGTVTR